MPEQKKRKYKSKRLPAVKEFTMSCKIFLSLIAASGSIAAIQHLRVELMVIS
jgi:hypothetical protein